LTIDFTKAFDTVDMLYSCLNLLVIMSDTQLSTGYSLFLLAGSSV